MSIFSRLFNKGQEGDAKPGGEPGGEPGGANATPTPHATTNADGTPRARESRPPGAGAEPDEDLGVFAADADEDDAIEEATKQQERPDLVIESSRSPGAKPPKEGTAPTGMPPLPASHVAPSAPVSASSVAAGSFAAAPPPDETSTAARPPSKLQPGTTPSRGGVAKRLPLPAAPSGASSPAAPSAASAASTPSTASAQYAPNQDVAMPPVPGASAPRGGRPVADLGKLFAGSDTQERPRVEELPVSLNDPRARTDASDARNLFIELGGNYMVPVRDFMFDVKSGEARVDWLRTCESSVQMLKGVADGLVMTKLAHALEKFAQVLKAAGTYQEQTIRGDTRDTLLAAYFNLIDLMPQAFGLDAERSRRETIIINSLLLQIPGVSRSAVDLMHAAGLDSLDTILAAVPGQIAATTGLPAETATKIIEKVLAHRKELETGSLAGLPPPPAPEGMGAPPMPGTRGHRTASPSTFDSVEAMTDGASIDLLVEEALHEGAPTGNAGAAGPTAKLLPASPDRDLLESLLKQLRTQTAELATVAEGWSDAAKTRRRGLRKARTDLLQQVKVVLLRLGETEGASEIDKLSLERKLERIERYLRV